VTRKPSDVTDAELSILQVLWERGSATIREITEAVYPQGGLSEYATVKKLAARLEAKRCVQRDNSQKAHVLRATIGRDELIGRRLQEVADSLCEGTWSPLVTQLIQAKGLTVKQQRMLNALIDDMEKKNEKRK
jgi:BlaI family transcriptional regulator, penicillinase repressor